MGLLFYLMDNNSLIQLYHFKDFDMDKFVRRYLYEISEHKEVEDIDMFTGEDTYITIKAHAGVKNVDKIALKCQYLQDVIIRKAHSKYGNKTFSLNADVLKSIVGKEYKIMLNVLRQMGYIELGDGYHGAEKHYYYVVGEYSTLYTMKDNVEYYLTEPFFNKIIRDYKAKALKTTQTYQKVYVDDKIIKLYGQDFYHRYIHSLNSIKISDKQGLLEFINAMIKDNPQAAAYYRYLLDCLEGNDKRITKIDSSNRFYHILTNAKREVKRYCNLDFTLDCKNSHPLLFNYFIFRSHNIDTCTSYNIGLTFKHLYLYYLNTSGSISSKNNISFNNSFHNDGQNLRISLIKSNIEKEEVAKLSDDEIEYIYKTTNGILWDELTDWVMNNPSVIDKWKEYRDDKDRLLYPELSTARGDELRKAVRGALKEEMFRQSFYSSTPKVLDDYDIGKEFARRYPNVFALIGAWKKTKNKQQVIEYMKAHNLPSNKGTSSLSIAMMGLESKIFTTILKRMYAKRWNAVHIHDCIVIPQDGNVNHPTKQQVQDIMLDVYKSFGLCPTFD